MIQVLLIDCVETRNHLISLEFEGSVVHLHVAGDSIIIDNLSIRDMTCQVPHYFLRDTTHIDAGAAELLLFCNYYCLPKICGSPCSSEASTSSSNDDKVSESVWFGKVSDTGREHSNINY